MKYALFALGLLLIFIGGYSIYVGSGIIEIERGWSSVIAGTTALVGGLVILGLAWIIKTLEQIRAAIEMRASAAQHPYEAGKNFADTPEMAIAPMAWPPHTAAVHGTVSEESAYDDGQHDHADQGAPADSFEPRFYGSPAAEPEAAAPTATGGRPVGAERAKASPSIKELWRRVAKDIDTTGSATRLTKRQHAEPPPLVAVPPPLPMRHESIPPGEEHGEAAAAGENADDWLNQALSELDMTLGEAPAFTHRADAVANEASLAVETASHGEPPHRDARIEEPAPPLSAEPQEGEAEAHEEAAVIGRYEAEGTNYTMFADGSIEAQSERGVARFKSMADLKAYFETQDAP